MPAMAKRFRLRISRVIPSFHSCRSKEDPSDPTPSVSSPPFPPPPAHQHILHVPVVSPAAGCGCRSLSRSARRNPTSSEEDDDENNAPATAEVHTPAYMWRKNEKWHVVARVIDVPPPPAPSSPSSPPRRKVDSEDGDDVLFPPLSLPRPSYRKEIARRKNGTKRRSTRKKNKTKHKQHLRSRGRASTSSADTRWFTSDDDDREHEDDDETDTLITSSRSSSRMPCPSPGTEGSSSPGRASSSSSVSWLVRRLMVMGRPSCAGAAAVKESVAVVKRSEDPYGDFRRSMVEMVLEKRIYEAAELEGLLRCFLELNDRRHHRDIVRAFSDVWDAIFASSCPSPSTPPPTRTPRSPVAVGPL